MHYIPTGHSITHQDFNYRGTLKPSKQLYASGNLKVLSPNQNSYSLNKYMPNLLTGSSLGVISEPLKDLWLFVWLHV